MVISARGLKSPVVDKFLQRGRTITTGNKDLVFRASIKIDMGERRIENRNQRENQQKTEERGEKYISLVVRSTGE